MSSFEIIVNHKMPSPNFSFSHSHLAQSLTIFSTPMLFEQLPSQWTHDNSHIFKFNLEL